MNPRDPVSSHFRLTKPQKSALEKLGIVTVRDLLFHFPARYGEAIPETQIAALEEGTTVHINGRISKLEKTRSFKTKVPMTRATLEDGSGKLRLVWFHQPYIAKMLADGAPLRISGKVARDKKGLYIANPDTHAPTDTVVTGPLLGGGEEHALQPVYPERRGITSRWFLYAIRKALAAGTHTQLAELLPEDLRARYNLPAIATALVWIHQPRTIGDSEAARKRFAFEEVLSIQLNRQRMRRTYKNARAIRVPDAGSSASAFTERMPFELTNAQQRAIRDISRDISKQTPMVRLLEGDVGSGKTAVAAATIYATVTSRPEGQDFGNLQAAIMAPTEILARQHFASFIEHFSHLPIQIGLIASSGCYKFPSKVNPREATPISRNQLLKWVANGEIPVLVGTHALIQKSVQFKHLAYAVIDEQHRFGTMQRMRFARRDDGPTPHLLSMTATPIPRTLALTVFGDLDLTLLDEMPPGRKPPKTRIIAPNERKDMYEEVRRELAAGRQAYVICPRINEPDPEKEQALNVRSVKEEAARLAQDVFPEYTIGVVHSKLKTAERDEVMEQFAQGKTHVLVATSVVEVGVNVPNATVIIIEDGERFGLAQIHQLRGRVLRSTHQAYCFITCKNKSGDSAKRLRAAQKAENGFTLAEYDLELRGPGELAGMRQWGVSDVGMEAIRNLKMVEAARAEAENLLDTDPSLKNHPNLAERVGKMDTVLHLE